MLREGAKKEVASDAAGGRGACLSAFLRRSSGLVFSVTARMEFSHLAIKVCEDGFSEALEVANYVPLGLGVCCC